MAIYTQKCEQKWLKINNRGGGGAGLEERYPGLKKIEKLTIGGDDNSALESNSKSIKICPNQHADLHRIFFTGDPLIKKLFRNIA